MLNIDLNTKMFKKTIILNKKYYTLQYYNKYKLLFIIIRLKQKFENI